jgi:hypothetical protein
MGKGARWRKSASELLYCSRDADPNARGTQTKDHIARLIVWNRVNSKEIVIFFPLQTKLWIGLPIRFLDY